MNPITTLPPVPNPKTDNKEVFNSKALAFFSALPTLAAEIDTIIDTTNQNAVDASESAISSATQAGLATQKANEANSSANNAQNSATQAENAKNLILGYVIPTEATDSTETINNKVRMSQILNITGA